MPTRKAAASWDGSIQEGNGTMRLGSGAYEGPYSFQSRFQEGDGTNPEELIGAAHAGCFTMALSGFLGRAGYEPESIETDATVQIDKVGDGFKITSIALSTRAKVPGIDQGELEKQVQEAKENCPVSVALAATDISVESELID